MNTSKANTNNSWLDEFEDMPVLENEEMWSQRVIDEHTKKLLDEIEEDENVNQKRKK